MTTLRATPVPSLAGTIRVPSDKSITHRAILLAAVSDRTVTITGGLDSADTAATLGAVISSTIATTHALRHDIRKLRVKNSLHSTALPSREV